MTARVHATAARNASPHHEIALALQAAQRPLLVLGYGAVLADAHAEIEEMVRRLPRLRVVASPKAKGAFSERHPRYLGVVGFAGHDAANEFLFESSDFLLVVGTRLGELTSNNWDPRWRRLPSARIDANEHALASWCESNIRLRSDAKLALGEVLHHLPRRVRVRSKLDVRSTALDSPNAEESTECALTPQTVFELLNRVFPADGHVFSGIGNTMAWGIHCLQRTVSNRWHVNLAAGAMGHAIPAAIGAALTGARALAVVGDAEFLMTGYEIHTAVENQIPLTVIVLNDAGHGMVRIGSRVHCGGKTPTCDFQTPVDIVRACRAQGAYASRPRTLPDLERGLLATRVRGGPTIFDVAISREACPPLGARLAALTQAFGSRSQNGGTSEP